MNNPCDICYLTRSKITFECSHEICIICLINIINTGSLSCPFCRRKYDIFEITDNPPYEITIQEKDNIYSSILEGKLYETKIFHDRIYNINFLVLGTFFDQNLIVKLLNQIIPTYGVSIQRIKQESYHGEYSFVPVDHYLQDYLDVIIKQVVR